ncbi:hypothetical protein H9P43_009192 [Blastocladiella emersonii ATCC 22665]|nr:hypothetical protein H9P43_009192 [Blastocladiella emersonii ATCC 22665]
MDSSQQHPSSLRKRQSASLVDPADDPATSPAPVAPLSPPVGALIGSPHPTLGGDSLASSGDCTIVTGDEGEDDDDDDDDDPATYVGSASSPVSKPGSPPPPLPASPPPTQSRPLHATPARSSGTLHQVSPGPAPLPNTSPYISGRWFVDRHGRRLLLRGVNLSGNAKSPFEPLMPSHVAEGFFRDLDVSFVGRPFPLAEADHHLALLRSWGFNVLRLCLTWEAVEHYGPGIYDAEYADYLVAVVRRAAHHGLTCILDPHQDVWSRHCGGSGAPNWTLRLVGLNAEALYDAGAAMCHAEWMARHPEANGDPSAYPKMIWQTNYYKLAAATMFTLFFGGDAFAPRLTVDDGDGERYSVQAFLQFHFIHAMLFVARRVHAAGLTNLASAPPTQLLPAVLGWDTFNEPNQGWIGCPDLSALLPWQSLRNGATPTPIQALRAGAGYTVTGVAQFRIAWCGPVPDGSTTLNPAGRTAWLDRRRSPAELRAEGVAAAKAAGRRIERLGARIGSMFAPASGAAGDAVPAGGCIWAAHGVYDAASPRGAVRADYFARDPKHGFAITPEAFTEHYWWPFVERFGAALRSVDPATLVFLDPPVNEEPPNLQHALTLHGGYGGGKLAGAEPLPPPPPTWASKRSAPELVDADLDEKPAGTRSMGTGPPLPLPSVSMSGITSATHLHVSPPPTPKGEREFRADPAFARDLVYAPHWYDGLTLITKHHWPYNVDFLHILRGRKNWVTGLRVGYAGVRRGMAASLGLIAEEGASHLGPNVPVLIGEIGIPFDMDPPARESPSPLAARAMDANLAALDAHRLHATIWNYCADNSRAAGDGWNGEDLSVGFQGNPRPARALLRPVFRAAAADDVMHTAFDMHRRVFDATLLRTEPMCPDCCCSPASGTQEQPPPRPWIDAPPVSDLTSLPASRVSEVYLPWLHFRGPAHTTVAVSAGGAVVDFARQTLYWVHGAPVHDGAATESPRVCSGCGAVADALTGWPRVQRTVRLQVRGEAVGNDADAPAPDDWVPRGCPAGLWCAWTQPGGVAEFEDKAGKRRRCGCWRAVMKWFGLA